MGRGDRIHVRAIRCSGRVGVTEQERRQLQRIDVDVEIEGDLTAAAASDEIDDTIDYTAVVEAVRTVVEGSAANLIETLGGRICERLLEDSRVGEVDVTVTKYPVDLAGMLDSVSVRMRRRR